MKNRFGFVEAIGVRLDALISILSFPLKLAWMHFRFVLLVFSVLLLSNGASGQLEDVSAQSIVSGSAGGSFSGCGLSCADFNGDGWDDITLSETEGTIKLYAGGPNGPELTQILTGTGEGRGVLWIDVDEDGDLDLWVVRFEGALELHIQGPDGTLTEEGVERGLPQLEGWRPRGLSANDYDRDGDLDVYITTYHIDTQEAFYPNLFLRNDGTGHFAEVAAEAGVGNGIQTTFQGGWLDYDDDGWDDLWVINDRFLFSNSLYRNLGDGTFEDVAPELGLDVNLDPMTATIFDPDQDGDWDLFSTDVANFAHQFFECTDTGYVDVADAVGVSGVSDYGWGGCVVDIDGDRREDLMVATNFFPSESPSDNRIYMNVEAGLGFNENSAIWPNEQYPVYNLGRFDLDQDRSPDIACHGSLPTVQLLRTTNDGGASRLALRLVGTESNSHAVGARIKVHSGGKVQMQQVDAGADYQTQHAFTRFFGMGDLVSVDSIEVRWPTGITETWYGLSADTAAALIEGTSTAALVEVERECPWEPQGWLLPFPSDSVAMTWNGLPVDSDTVWATTSGLHVLEATWWDGRFSWTQMVGVTVEPIPKLEVTVSPAACPWDSALVQWSAPDSGTVTVNDELPITDVWWASEAVDSLSLVWMHPDGCQLDSIVSVEIPEAVDIEWTLLDAPCAGETGEAEATITGGTPPWSAVWLGLDSDALVAGVYPVQFTDAVGCLVANSVTIEEPDSLDVEISLSYAGLSDTAQVNLSISGGTLPYLVDWSGGFGGGALLAPGFLGWLVEDAQGCIAFGTVEVPSNPLQSVETMAPVHGCVREEGGIRILGQDFAGLEVELHDLTGRLLFRGNVLESGRIPYRVDGVVLVRLTDRLGRSSVWVR